jgi:hypothetical protein
MTRFFTIEDASTKSHGLPMYPPQVKIVRRHMAASSGLLPWRPMSVRLVLLRSKRQAEHVG